MHQFDTFPGGLGVFSDTSESDESPNASTAVSVLTSDAQDMLGFDDDENPDIYGNAKWRRWLTQARDDILADMDSLLPMTTWTFDANGATGYDLLGRGFLYVGRVGYGTSSTTATNWLPLRTDRQGTGAVVPVESGTPGWAWTEGLATLALNPYPTSGTVTVEGRRLPVDLQNQTDTSGLPRVFNETLALGAALRACRHDMGRSENAAARGTLQDEYTAKLGRMRALINRNPQNGGGYTVATGAVYAMRGRR